MAGNGQGFGNWGGAGQFAGGLGEFLGGMFGNPGKPYQDAMNKYQGYLDKGINAQNPFYQAGTGAIGDYQKWLGGMQDPGGFVNKMMGQYQESPWAKYQQQQAVRAGTNAASMGGLQNGMGGAGIGSSPFAQQMAQTASGISSEDMQNWLGNAMNANSEYGKGLGNEVGWGQHAGDQMSGMYGNAANWMGDQEYNQQAANGNRWGNVFGGLGNMGMGGAKMWFGGM